MGITYCNSNSILIHERTPYISSFGRFGKFAAGRSTEWGGGTKLKYKIYKAVTKGGVEMSTSLIKVMAVVKKWRPVKTRSFWLCVIQFFGHVMTFFAYPLVNIHKSYLKMVIYSGFTH